MSYHTQLVLCSLLCAVGWGLALRYYLAHRDALLSLYEAQDSYWAWHTGKIQKATKEKV